MKAIVYRNAVRVGNLWTDAFLPYNQTALDVLLKCKLDEPVTIEVKRERNLAHHNKYFALLGKVYENQDWYQSVEDISTAFKFAIGHTRKIKTRDGIHEIPLSISFAAMDQAAFDAFYSKAVDFLVAKVIPGLNRAELEREVMEMI